MVSGDIEDDRENVSALLARIAALEKENKQLREQQQLISRYVSGANNDGERHRRWSNVYFDGFKTRVDDDDDHQDEAGEQNASCIPVHEEHKVEEYTSTSADSSSSLPSAHFTLGENRYMKRANERVQEIIKTSVTSSIALENNDDNSIGLRSSGRRAKSESDLHASSEGEDVDESEGERHSSVSDKMFPIPRGVQLFMRIHSMNKKFTTRSSLRVVSSESQGPMLYDQFALLSLDPTDDRLRKLSSWSDNGSRFLDSFVLKTAHCIDSYPIQLKGEGFAPEDLSAFCCLDGVNVRLVPRAAVDGTMRIGTWFKDDHKLLAFTDGLGLTTYGVAMTVYREVSADEEGYNQLLTCLLDRRRMRAAACLIIRWWRSYAKMKVRRVDTDRSIQSKKSRPQLSPKLSSKMKNLVQSGRREGRNRREGSALSQSFQGGMKKIQVGVKKITRVRNVQSSPDENDIEAESNLVALPDTPPIIDEQSSFTETNSVSKTTRHLAKESFDLMNSESDMDVIFVQQCYVMIGGKQSEQFLQLRLLKHLIEMEMKTIGNDLSQDAGMHDLDVDFLPENRTIRRKFLETIRHIHLSKKQDRVELPSEDIEIIRQSPPTFSIDLPAFDWVTNVRIPLPLPQVANDWGVAQLFLSLTPDYICSIVKLMLVERSILVVGQSSELVTSSVLALMQLLRPFSWASNCLPLLPFAMLDFVSSPVPFVAGMVCNGIKFSEIIDRDEVKDAMKEGLSVVELTQGKLLVTTEKGVRKIVEQSPAPVQRLSAFKERLERLRDDGDSSLASFGVFLKKGLTREELVTLNAIRNCIKDYVKGFTGSISSSNDGWRQYGKYEQNGQFAFFPSLFIAPLTQQLHLQEMMCHSQLFIEYVDKKERASKETSSDVARFIADFVYFHWRRRQRIVSTVIS